MLVLRFQSLGCESCLRASGLFFCALSRFTNQVLFSLFSLSERRERSHRSSLSDRRLRFVVVGHFFPFGACFSVFRSRRPCASVRDRLTTSVYSGFWHTSYFLPLEEHCGVGDHLRGHTSLPIPNSLFSGPRTARFGPRTFVLHPFWSVFGRVPIFTIREVVGWWPATYSPEKPIFSFCLSKSRFF